RALVAAALLVGSAPAAAKRPVAAACYGSYLVPDGQAPLIGGGQAAVDAVVLTASGVRIRSGCPLVPAALRRLNSGWKVVACWDGVVDPDEECDDGNLMNGDGCNDCRLPRCGDGILDLGEQCDDGNTDDTDGCTNACQHVCEGQAFTSTWQAIETAIFIQRGCTNATCHSGEAPSGGLDLRPEAAWTSLVNVPSTIDPGTMRVLPGDQDASLL